MYAKTAASRELAAPIDLKVPPHSIEAEQAVLGGLMIDPEAWDVVTEKIGDSDFYRHDHRLIFRSMRELNALEKPIDVITLQDALESINELDSVGGLAYLGALANNTASSVNIAAYAEIVRERSLLRRLIQVGTEITQGAFDPQGKPVGDLVDAAEREVFAISEHSGRSVQGPQLLSEVFTKTVDRIDMLFRANSPITGIPTGFIDFDRMCSGLQASDLIIIAGRPSMGKTTFAMNIAEHVAMKQSGAVLVFSMEMPAESIAMRMLSSLGRIEQQRIRSGQLTDDDWPRLSSTISLMANKKMLIDDSGNLSPSEVRARARRIVREHGALSLIVIDYLQLMRVPGVDNRVNEISEISRSLKGLAKELNVPVIALSQLNRGLEQRVEKRPIMSDLRESGAIEQDADLIAFVYRDEVYNKDSNDKGTAEIIIGKQRNGPIGTVRLTFLGQYSRFDNHLSDKQLEDY